MTSARWSLAPVLATVLIALPVKCPKSSSGGTTGGTQRPEAAIWVGRDRISAKPMGGAAWENLLAIAQQSTAQPNLSDQNDPTNTRTLAKALVFARTGQAAYRDQVIAACDRAIGTENGGSTLAVGRNLAAFVIAADLVDLPAASEARFTAWLRTILHRDFAGRTLISTHQDRPNNWGTMAGASRAAVAAYLGDDNELFRTATVFRGWLGDRSAYTGFVFPDVSWQADPSRLVPINIKDSEIDGHSVDGVLPDDQRRGGPFQWPPPRENYVYEALQGALLQAMILDRAGYDPWEWSDRALLRAFRWLNDVADYPAEGDDGWQPYVVNWAYGTTLNAPPYSPPGKNVGFTDWTHSTD